MKFVCRALAAGALALIIAAPASAQSTRIGAKLGLTSATITGDDVNDAGSLTGFSGGGFLTFQISPAFAIQPELLWLAKGASVDDTGEFEADLKFGYIEVPVLAKFSFGTGPLRPHLFAGPYIAFQSSCKAEGSVQGNEESVDCDAEGIDVTLFKDVDFGGVGGVGFDYELASGIALLLDARLDLGLTNIIDEGSAEAKNRAWSFFVGASFPLSGR